MWIIVYYSINLYLIWIMNKLKWAIAIMYSYEQLKKDID